MSVMSTVGTMVEVQDAEGPILEYAPLPRRLTGTVAARERVTLTASVFTALTVPDGARWVCVIVGEATGLTLKGVTADTGIQIAPTLAADRTRMDACLPIFSTNLGIDNAVATDQDVDVIWIG